MSFVQTDKVVQNNGEQAEFEFVASLIRDVQRLAGEDAPDDAELITFLTVLDGLLFRHRTDETFGHYEEAAGATASLRVAVEFYLSSEKNIAAAAKELLQADSCSDARRYLYLTRFLPRTLVPRLVPSAQSTAKWATKFVKEVSKSSWLRSDVSEERQREAIAAFISGLVLNNKAADTTVFAAHLTHGLSKFNMKGGNWFTDQLVKETVLSVPKGIGHTELKVYDTRNAVTKQILKHTLKKTHKLVIKYSGSFDSLVFLGNVQTKEPTFPTNTDLAQSINAGLADVTTSMDDDLTFVNGLVGRFVDSTSKVAVTKKQEASSVFEALLDQLDKHNKTATDDATTALRMKITFYGDHETNLMNAVSEVLDARCSNERRNLYATWFIKEQILVPLNRASGGTNPVTWTSSLVNSAFRSSWAARHEVRGSRGTKFTPRQQHTRAAQRQMVKALFRDVKQLGKAEDVFASEITSQLHNVGTASWLITDLIEEALLKVSEGIGYRELNKYAELAGTEQFMADLLQLFLRKDVKKRIDASEVEFIKRHSRGGFATAMLLVRTFSAGKHHTAGPIATKDPGDPQVMTMLGYAKEELKKYKSKKRVRSQVEDQLLQTLVELSIQLLKGGGLARDPNHPAPREFLEQLDAIIVKQRYGVGGGWYASRMSSRCAKVKKPPAESTKLLEAIRQLRNLVVFNSNPEPKKSLEISMKQIMRYDGETDSQIAATLFVYMHLVQCTFVPTILGDAREEAEKAKYKKKGSMVDTSWIKLFFRSCDKIEHEHNQYDREEETFISEVVETITNSGTTEYEAFISQYLTGKARKGKLSPFFVHPYYSAVADKVEGTSYNDEKKHIELESSKTRGDVRLLLTYFFEELGTTKTVIARQRSEPFEKINDLPNTNIQQVAEFLGGGRGKVDFDILAELFDFDVNGKPVDAAKERKDVLAALKNTNDHANELVLVLQQVRVHTKLGYDSVGLFSSGNFDTESTEHAQRIYKAHKDSKDATLKEEVDKLKYAILPFGCKFPILSYFWSGCDW